MLKKEFIRPDLSINRLGKFRFWVGIIMGIIASVTLFYFFVLSRELLQVIAHYTRSPVLTIKEVNIYDLFFAATATSLGFGYTIIIWLGDLRRNTKKHFLKLLAITNALLLIFIILMLGARFETLMMILNIFHGEPSHLSFIIDFPIILITLPIYLFFVNWNTIRLIYRARKWVFWSVAFYLLLTLLLFALKTPSIFH